MGFFLILDLLPIRTQSERPGSLAQFLPLFLTVRCLSCKAVRGILENPLIVYKSPGSQYMVIIVYKTIKRLMLSSL